MMRLLYELDEIDQIILPGKIIHSPAMTDRTCAEMVYRQTGRRISHQAISKRYPKALERLRQLAGISL